ncbi:MAG: NAD(P)/FAD-dependent oxidoreductase [Flavobacteriales bacterium]|jgi:predicted Rossmann fold flavoprotein
MSKTIVIIGGGAAGFFTAINIDAPSGTRIFILEKSNKLLSKVKISGGGRCNVTHACFEPKELVKFYPRGTKELNGPFHQFSTGDTFEWFASRGVELKIEDDNRSFPITDSSQTIIDCFLKEAEKKNIKVETQNGLEELTFDDEQNRWMVHTTSGGVIASEVVVIAAGSSPQMWDKLKGFGLNMIDQVPSLFTFNIKDRRIDGLAGLSSTHARVTIPSLKIDALGPVLVTHWGLSGPGILKISAIAARSLSHLNYQFEVTVNWLANEDLESLTELFKTLRTEQSRKLIHSFSPVDIPSRLWTALIQEAVDPNLKWADISNKAIDAIANAHVNCKFRVEGKSTFKDEFVTAGGVDLKEIDFKTMEAKRFKGLYFAGEVLDIDAVTGGFNFQAAWTTSIIAARSISKSLSSEKSF